MIKKFILSALLVTIAATGWSQIVVRDTDNVYNADSVRREFDKQPFFSLYKDNYFTLGTSVGPAPTRENSDVKFQVSFAQRLTKSTLPGHTYLFLFYSQKTLWNVFEESLPMHDLNFNPGIGLARAFISKNRIVGKATLMIEHESNGRDSLASRSWNKISLSGEIFIDENLMVHAKYWIPIIDGENNKDILKYSGIFQTGIQYRSRNNRWVFDALLTKRQGWNLNHNVQLQLGFRVSRKANQYLMLQYYNGYGECMLDYNKYHNRLRIGMLIRPDFFSNF